MSWKNRNLTQQEKDEIERRRAIQNDSMDGGDYQGNPQIDEIERLFNDYPNGIPATDGRGLNSDDY